MMNSSPFTLAILPSFSPSLVRTVIPSRIDVRKSRISSPFAGGFRYPQKRCGGVEGWLSTGAKKSGRLGLRPAQLGDGRLLLLLGPACLLAGLRGLELLGRSEELVHLRAGQHHRRG